MAAITGALTRWGLDGGPVRDRLDRAPTPRERERWHARWLLAHGWPATTVAAVLERAAHTSGGWLAACERDGPGALACAPTGGPPAARAPEAQAGLLQGAVHAAPAAVGSALANWHWQVVRRCSEARCGIRRCSEARCGIRRCRSACTRSLHRRGCVDTRPKQRLRTADEAQRATFVQDYATLLAEGQATGATIFFADAAHCRADADLRGKGVRKGCPALVDATCPRWGEQASDSAAVCLATGAVAPRELTGTSSSATSTAFLQQRRANHPGPRVVIGDNGPAQGGDAVRDDLATPALGLRLVRLPAYRPACNPDAAIGAWARAEVTAQTGLGSTAAVQEQLQRCFAGLPTRVAAVQSRCRHTLQALAEALAAQAAESQQEAHDGDPVGASV